MSGQRYCEQCGAALAPQLRFCERCGAPVRVAGAGGVPAPATTIATAPSPAVTVTEPRAAVQPTAVVRTPAGGMRPAIVTAALLAMLGSAGAWWLLRPAPPPPPGAGVDLAPSAYDELPGQLSPLPPQPAEAPPLPDDPLAQARARRERAYDRYTRIAIGEIDGDIAAARREFQDADAALKALESR
ncbi:MAG: zinc ribbon domain-containing protein [Rhodanobacteraceae bacterium]|nr:zinc ribbon domain-containing protein [Rhodanobacteraceae bacterium]